MTDIEQSQQKPSEPLTAEERWSLHRPQRLFFVFLLSFILLYAIHWFIFHILSERYRAVVSQTPEARLTEASATAIAWIRDAASYSDPVKTSEILWRVCESTDIEKAFLVNADRDIVGCSWKNATIEAATEFSLTPSLFARTIDTNSTVNEAISFFDINYRRLYQPLADGDARLALCLETYDSSHADIDAVASLMFLGRIIGLFSSLALAALIIFLLWSVERARRKMLRVDHLAAAGELSAAIAHEVKNPLAIILSATGLLETHGDEPDKRKRWLDTIRSSVKTAESHIETFLDLARDMPIRQTREDLRDIVRATVELVDSRVHQQGATLITDYSDAPVEAFVDRRKISQALVNLVFNSLDATGSGGIIKISVSVDQRDALIIISDNGGGIAPENMKNVFEPFFTTKPNGTGLGLLSVKRVVERHRGTLTLSSKHKEGVTATIRLPNRRAERTE